MCMFLTTVGPPPVSKANLVVFVWVFCLALALSLFCFGVVSLLFLLHDLPFVS